MHTVAGPIWLGQNSPSSRIVKTDWKSSPGVMDGSNQNWTLGVI